MWIELLSANNIPPLQFIRIGLRKIHTTLKASKSSDVHHRCSVNFYSGLGFEFLAARLFPATWIAVGKSWRIKFSRSPKGDFYHVDRVRSPRFGTMLFLWFRRTTNRWGLDRTFAPNCLSICCDETVFQYVSISLIAGVSANVCVLWVTPGTGDVRLSAICWRDFCRSNWQHGSNDSWPPCGLALPAMWSTSICWHIVGTFVSAKSSTMHLH